MSSDGLDGVVRGICTVTEREEEGAPNIAR
ncbi:hypothetical protein SAMN05216506_105322 [Saccharopolyspora kobensis]|uniref:Uncharacterized protein n=1 Tax=Saccharopolyspora kobensis TaxID=146035 RepID=A0ABY1DY90_9PSEU|nr:hypothetical protein SAMN05216506_105322 [Saccharopolyspora kobensis]